MKWSVHSVSGGGHYSSQAILVPQGLNKKLFPPTLIRLMEPLISQKIFTGKWNETLFLPFAGTKWKGKEQFEHLVLIGLGQLDQLDSERIRQAGGKLVRVLEKNAQKNVFLDFSLLQSFIKDFDRTAQSFSEGCVLADYCFKELQKKTPPRITRVQNIHLTQVKNLKEVKKELTEGQLIAESVNFARRLADTPSNLMNPSVLAKEVQKQLSPIRGLKVSVWNKNRIIKERMGGVLGVSAGSHQEPRVIIMEYHGRSSSSLRPLCLVGKGLTFDSGGISLKPAKSMDEMKFDMCGSCAVIGALLAIARLQWNVSVIGLVGAAENMPGGGAIKPGDILTARNGKTMEVLNTDAEGRLVLADILSYASEQKPELIVDAATLTGAIVVALGNIYAGLFTRHTSLQNQIQKASQSSGEKIWPMPLNDFHTRDIRSEVGDVANISAGFGAGSSTAAAFLEHFVDKKIPWAHLDIAGTAWNVENRLPYCRPKSASGVMVRTFVELIKQYAR